LQEQILHIEDPELDPVFNHVDAVFRQELAKNNNQHESLADRFRIQKEIIKAIAHFDQRSDHNAAKIKSKLESYFDKCKELGLKQSIHRGKTGMEKALRFLKLFLLTPFFIAGFFICAVPYLLTKRMYRKTYLPRLSSQDHSRPINPAFAGSIAFSIGTSLFLIWFLVLSAVVGALSGWWIGVLFFFVSYLLGQLSLRAMSLGYEIIEEFRHQKIVRNHPKEMEEIIQMRKELLDTLSEYQKSYVSKGQIASVE
jgi:membrane-associated protease RseP (regulator of RpoE activity)